jgi:bifunctional non-homologous end joining protein LigD
MKQWRLGQTGSDWPCFDQFSDRIDGRQAGERPRFAAGPTDRRRRKSSVLVHAQAKKSTMPKNAQSRPQPKPKKATAVGTPKLLGFRLTNPARIVYPELGLTKRDVAAYYAAVAKWMLPQVVDRPLSLVRCPTGLTGPCFFQQHPPAGIPAVVERIQIQEKSEVKIYVVIQNLEGLLALVQFGTLEIHAWGSRAGDVERPDRLVFDLDPDPAVSWNEVVDAAQSLRKTLLSIGLKSFLKTTGGKGLHLALPLAPRHTWPEVKVFAKQIADRMVAAEPEKYIASMSKAARRGKIFIDYLRNQRGATAVVAYSTRAKPNATVAMPIGWEELGRLTGPAQFTVKNVPARLAKQRSDPWKQMAHLRQTLPLRKV